MGSGRSINTPESQRLINQWSGVGVPVLQPGGRLMTGEYLNSLYLSEECEHWGAALTCPTRDLCHIA